MIFRWWSCLILGRPGRELEVICEWAWVCGAMIRQWWLVGFISWWWRVLRMWNLVIQRRWKRWIGIVLVVRLLRRRFLPLVLLAKDLNDVLELRKPGSLSIYVLPFGFDALSYGSLAGDGFLHLTEELNLVLDPGQLCFYRCFIL
jgi:hypothetical protein